ncbi:MAG TPA: ClpXP protease specificity-enhancing factor SspB [Myxococcota bacterium]|jgi:stringent starvation protein B|nr:ClpXP protease specificity-enhancing factor SspB [Myxococcota bacterium]
MADDAPPPPPPARPSKPAFVRGLLEHGSVFVHLDARVGGVDVPSAFRGEFRLVLQVGYDMKVPIPDLTVTDGELSATLSFSRRPHLCRIPWQAVFAVTGESGAGMAWPESFPVEVRRALIRALNTPDVADTGAAVPGTAAGRDAGAGVRPPGRARPRAFGLAPVQGATAETPRAPTAAPSGAKRLAEGRAPAERATPGASPKPRSGSGRGRRATPEGTVRRRKPARRAAPAASGTPGGPGRPPTATVPPPAAPTPPAAAAAAEPAAREIRRGHLRLVK